MTTLIVAYDKSGPIGRCDARCYDAKGDRCRCICGGRNHGVGLRKALDNAVDMGPKDYDKWPGWKKAELGKVYVTRCRPLRVGGYDEVEVGVSQGSG